MPVPAAGLVRAVRVPLGSFVILKSRLRLYSLRDDTFGF